MLKIKYNIQFLAKNDNWQDVVVQSIDYWIIAYKLPMGKIEIEKDISDLLERWNFNVFGYVYFEHENNKALVSLSRHFSHDDIKCKIRKLKIALLNEEV